MRLHDGGRAVGPRDPTPARERAMSPVVTAFLSGALFAVGLGVGGMTRPEKVIGFLDVTGTWDPSLVFVMAGAVGVNVILFRIILRRTGPVCGGRFQLPSRTDVDPRLVAGAALFGAGWGLVGYCPGPALVSLVAGGVPALVFVLAMAAGMVAEHLLLERSAAAIGRADPTEK
ncbi:Hypothetical protein A7982_01121 [Minicystis rosea]|nr:Hypothetical protein A7982_01121 [Minicystis rosea]